MAKLTYDKIKEYLGFEEVKKTKGKKKVGKWQIRDRRQFVLRLTLIGVIFFGVILIVGVIGLGIMVIAYSRELPPPGKPFDKNIAQSTNIYDKNGVLLASFYGNVERSWIPIGQVDHNMQWAMLSAEDVNFYSEPGIDIFGILRAGVSDILHHGSGLQGGSTITQQLVKNADLSDDQTLQRKIKEIILTLEVERQYSKSQILEAYLNEISFGGDTSGVKVAAEKYFNLEPSQLDIAQSAFIAGLAQAPSYYSPVFGEDPTLSDGNLASTDRAYYVLDQMLKHNDLTGVTADQVNAAKTEIKNFKFTGVIENYKAPHFVDYVRSILENEYGAQKLLTGGYQVYTTLDYNIQQEAEAEVNKMYADMQNKFKYNGEDAAMVSIDPKTGEVVAMVGSPKVYVDPKTKVVSTTSSQANYLTSVNIVTSGSKVSGGSGVQPGSSIKPLLYMSAFKNLGLAPTTLMPDIPISIPSYDGFTYPTPYAPTNFEGNYNGLFTIDQDLSISLNVPAVETLYSLTPTTFINDLNSFGYTNLTTANQGADLSYAIGGESVVFMDHVDAYAMMANGGILHPATTITKITDSSGKVLYQYDPSSVATQAIDPAYPYLMNDTLHHYQYMLQELQAHNASFYKQAFVQNQYDIAGKTGTNNTVNSNGTEGEASSLTFVGYTPNLVSGFWYGNDTNQGTPLKGVPIAENLIPYWGDYMQKVLPGLPKDKFQRPADVVDTQICKDTGLLYQSGNSCTVTTATFQKDHLPKVDNAHVSVQVCQNDPNSLATPSMISQGQSNTRNIIAYQTYDAFFQPMLNSFLKNSNVVPTAYCTSAQGLQVSIDSPSNNSSDAAGTQVTVSAEIAETNSQNTISSVAINFDNSQVGTLAHTSGSNYSGKFVIPANTSNGSYKLSVVATDSTGGTNSDSVTLQIGPSSQPTPQPGSSDITIVQPKAGTSVSSKKSTMLELSYGQDPNSVSSSFFAIYQNGQQIGSNITATQDSSNNNQYDASYTFPVSSSPFYVSGCVVANGSTACNGVSVSEN